MKKAPLFVLIAAITLTVASFGSCVKMKLDCDCVVRPMMQYEEKGESVQISDVVAYAFHADTSKWAVASYSDALAGVITDKETGETMEYDYTDELWEDGNFKINFTSRPAMMLICNLTQEMYGWAQVPLYDNLDKIILTVTFAPWRPNEAYRDGIWHMVNGDTYVPDVDPDGGEVTGSESNGFLYGPAL